MIFFKFKKHIFSGKACLGLKLLTINPPDFPSTRLDSTIWFQTRNHRWNLHSFNGKPAFIGYDIVQQAYEHVLYYSNGVETVTSRTISL